MKLMNLVNHFYKMKYRTLIALCVVMAGVFTGCSSHEDAPAQSKIDLFQDNDTEAVQVQAEVDDKASNIATTEESLNDEENEDASEKRSMENMLKLFINDEEIPVTWEENESVEALRALAENGSILIDMSMYGGFEQVGYIGQSLPRNDKQMTTRAGDIVLYSGDQMVVFYGSNSWAYTKLGHIDGMTEKELEEILGSSDVTITISANEK